jgi:hypothetical protein
MLRSTTKRDLPVGAPAPVTEHVTRLSGGGYQIWPAGPETEAVYPLAQRIETQHHQVYRRTTTTTTVIDDWQEVSHP